MPKVILDTAEMEFGEEVRVIEPSAPKDSSTENGRDNEFVSFAAEHGLTPPEDNEASEARQPESPPAAESAKEEPESAEAVQPTENRESNEKASASEAVPEMRAEADEQEPSPLEELSPDNQRIEPSTPREENVPLKTLEEERAGAVASEVPLAQSPPEVHDIQQPSIPDVTRVHEEAQSEAQRIVQTAEEKASRIVQQANDEAESITQQAAERGEERGNQEGYQEGYQSGQKALDFVVERLRVISGRLLDQRKSILIDAEAQIIALVLLIAKKVVKHIAGKDREVVIENVRQALHLLSAERQITIRVNPDDLKLSEEELKRITAALEKEKTIAFYADATIEKGGCLIETDLGNIDAQISSQLLELEQQIQSMESLRQPRVTS